MSLSLAQAEQPWTAEEDGLPCPMSSSRGWVVADGQKVDRRAPPHVVTCGGGLATGHTGGPCSHGQPEKKGRHVPCTLVREETETELLLVGWTMRPQTARKNQGCRALHVLARGWIFQLATKVDQAAASGKKKWASVPRASLHGVC